MLLELVVRPSRLQFCGRKIGLTLTRLFSERYTNSHATSVRRQLQASFFKSPISFFFSFI